MRKNQACGKMLRKELSLSNTAVTFFFETCVSQWCSKKSVPVLHFFFSLLYMWLCNNPTAMPTFLMWFYLQKDVEICWSGFVLGGRAELGWAPVRLPQRSSEPGRPIQRRQTVPTCIWQDFFPLRQVGKTLWGKTMTTTSIHLIKTKSAKAQLARSLLPSCCLSIKETCVKVFLEAFPKSHELFFKNTEGLLMKAWKTIHFEFIESCF